MSLRRRLLLTLAPLFVAGLIAVDVATYLSLQSFLIQRVDQQLLTAHPFVEQSLLHGSFGDEGRGPGGGPTDNFPSGTVGEIVSPTGTVFVGPRAFGPRGTVSSSAAPILSSPLHAGTQQNHTIFEAAGTGGVSRFRVLVDTVAGTPSGSALLVVAIPLNDVTSTLSQVLLLELATTAAVTLIVLLVSWLIVRRGLRPLEHMGSTARIAATDLSRRVEPATESTEVGRLGLAINAMLAQLESAFAERAAGELRLRHFVSDASHELRTPLTSMRGYAELLRRNPAMTEADVLLATRRIEEEAQRMGVLVDDLLLLARLDQGRPLERVPVDLVAMVTDAGADARATDTTRSITVRIDASVEVIGDDMRLRQVLGNVVRNALVHTPPGSPVELTLGVDGATAVLEVADHGHGIPAEQAHRVFERFHRSDPGRSRDQGGSGLGLSIAAAVIAAHGGRILVRDTPGGGATFRIELPAVTIAAMPPVDSTTPAAAPPA
jgi:two-component system OmpR family sensor kinase